MLEEALLCLLLLSWIVYVDFFIVIENGEAFFFLIFMKHAL